MRKILWVMLLLLLVPLVATAQTPQVEVYGGYAYANVDFKGISNLFDGHSRNWNGWEASFATNFTRHVGVTFDFSGDYGPSVRAGLDGFSPRLRDQTQYLYAYLAGPQFLLPLRRVTLFAHALAGATQMQRGFTGSPFPIARSNIAFGSAVGGGIDVGLTQYVALRVLQADYLMSKNFGGSENNLRVSGGIVFQFGNK